MSAWPTAELDAVVRLRVLAAGLPQVALEERVVAVGFARVWALLGDLERGAPRFETGIEEVRVLEREGDRLRVKARGSRGPAVELAAELRTGWCLMSSASVVIGMAAAPEGSGTRIAHFEGMPGLVGRLARPLFRWKVRRELAHVARLLEG